MTDDMEHLFICCLAICVCLWGGGGADGDSAQSLQYSAGTELVLNKHQLRNYVKKKNQKPKPKPNQTKGNESCSKTHLLTPMPFFWQFPTLRSHCTCHVLSGQFGFPTDSSALCRLQAPTTFFCSISLSHALYLTMEDSLLSYLSLSCKLFEGKD